jgi:hypothetical protein
LPILPVYLRNIWYDPTKSHGPLTQEKIAQWQNLNSFAARVMATDYVRWFTFPIWQLSGALEEPLPVENVLATNCLLFVASEWLIHASKVLFEQMSYRKEDAEDVIFQTGSLCEGVSQMGVDRWEFWEQRICVILKEKESLGLTNATFEHVQKAMKAIDDLTGTNDDNTDYVKITKEVEVFKSAEDAKDLEDPKLVKTVEDTGDSDNGEYIMISKDAGDGDVKDTKQRD